MPFCARCRDRTARCLRQCEREADGERLWRVVHDELARIRGGGIAPLLAWDRQSGDVQSAFIEGARAMRERAR